MRRLYVAILWMHPVAFRARFSSEMLSIFDEAGASAELVRDGLISVGRQWLLRTGLWKAFLASLIAGMQFWAIVMPEVSPQGGRTQGPRSGHLQELIFITLAMICSLFVMVTLLTLWAMRFHKGRSR